MQKRLLGQGMPAVLLGIAQPVTAGEADVLAVNAECATPDSCAFAVTVRHADTGWDHYADAWEVLSVDGELLATRVLAHPHVHEQPFTRSLPAVSIPPGITEVVVRARDSLHGYGGREVRIELDRAQADQAF